MDNESSAPDFQFIQLILSLHGAVMQQMGKVQSPVTGKIERDLAMCKSTIDMIEMIERKTKGNLSEDEARLVERVLFECRMNFVDEAKKDQAAAGGETPPGTVETPPKSEPPDGNV